MISVVIPIYNVKEYLAECVESVMNQTYSNLEIILVDDGSTDGSSCICEEFREKDSRIKVIHKENEGVVSARKAGVRAASGEMIGFVDADDWIEPDYFERLAGAWQETGADIVAVGHFHDIGKSSRKVLNGLPAGIYNTGDILDTVLYSGEFYEYGIAPHLWSKILRPDILKAAQEKVDDRIRGGDDAAVVYPAILMAKTVCVADFCRYHYVQRQGSITKTCDQEEIVRVQLLTEFLERRIRELAPDARSREALLGQLAVYRNYIMSLRGIDVFDEMVLLPFGGIPYGCKVVVYGAGVLGQRIHQYLLDSKRVEIAGWVDRNYGYYRENGFCVDRPETISSQAYDYVLIANISYRTSVNIKKYLVDELAVSESKIRWFSDEFIKNGGHGPCQSL